MCEYPERSHTNGRAPSVKRVPAIFRSVCDSQENVARAKRFPNVISEAAQPEENGHHARLGDHVCNGHICRRKFGQLLRPALT